MKSQFCSSHNLLTVICVISLWAIICSFISNSSQRWSQEKRQRKIGNCTSAFSREWTVIFLKTRWMITCRGSAWLSCSITVSKRGARWGEGLKAQRIYWSWPYLCLSYQVLWLLLKSFGFVFHQQCPNNLQVDRFLLSIIATTTPNTDSFSNRRPVSVENFSLQFSGL